MQPDLINLYITRDELQQLAGMSRRDWKAYDTLKKSDNIQIIILPGYLEQVFLLGWGLIPLYYLYKWKYRRQRLRNLLLEVDRYNDLIRIINLGDELEAAGNQGASIENRQKAIAALQITRNSLSCAIKTEKILRKNRDLINRNLDLLSNGILSLQALQINAEASEYSKLLNEAVQLTIDVQTEMKKLEASGEKS
ncbi:hypothetical protein H6G17_18290 [Chroococcidiopsis sp. FACHB-1243]|uniref:hypothetical protein n=1 Tax=Chroococcidiopsis sp. [FACHB-1243] TaxID=2692781 RepID=UPI001786C21A|nr:hypothetical protein [Chroococcidiopsis sp. [FACHB-1243]]MBD2307427.1 hypothetical protein [Chroococcidiopsis sp. [FACHB-1243]]